jgi:FSR family fosmidomycin resistance protein-like MFS transporter
MSVFMLGGNTGYAIGPIIAAAAMTAFGLHGSIVISLIGLLLAPLVLTAQRVQARVAPQTTSRSAHAQTATAQPARTFSALAVVALMLIMFLRAWTQSATTAYIPAYFTSVVGMSVAEASRISSLNLFALAAGGLAGGLLADRFGGRKVMILSWLIYGPATFALFNASGGAVFVIAALTGFVAGASWPPLIVMAQELFPRNAGVASGIALGFAFAMGGIGTALTGFLAEPERLGISASLMMLGALPLLAAGLALMLPKDARTASTPAPTREPAAEVTPAR